MAELLGARARRELLLDLERPERGRVRARQPQLVRDQVGDDRLCAADRDQSTCDDERSKDADAVLPTDTFRAWWGCV